MMCVPYYMVLALVRRFVSHQSENYKAMVKLRSLSIFTVVTVVCAPIIILGNPTLIGFSRPSLHLSSPNLSFPIKQRIRKSPF